MNKIKDFLKNLKHLGLSRKRRLALFAVLVILIGGIITYLPYSHLQDDKNVVESLNAKVQSLESQKLDLSAKNKAALKELSVKQELIEVKDTEIARNLEEIQKRDATIKELNDQISSLKSQRKVAQAIPKAVAGSIYDRIHVNPPFRDQIIRALRMIEGATPEYFSRINSQVAYINETSMCGGWQLTRDINIGSCGGTFSDPIVASLIIHESTHVYNVYVDGIYSMHTKEQELPCYLAERDVEARLNVPQDYREMTAQKIAYWSSL